MENLESVQKVVFSCPSCQKAYESEVQHIQSSTPVFFCQQCSHFFGFNYQLGIQHPVTFKIDAQGGLQNRVESSVSHESQSALESRVIAGAFDQPERPEFLNERPLETEVTMRDSKELSLTAESLDASAVTCPLCSHSNGASQKECARCGLDFERYKEKQERIERSQKHQVFETGSDDDLEFQWKSLLNEWNDESRHQAFLSLCDKKKCLSFAAGKYNKYLLEKPQDVWAKKMKTRIRSLAESELMVQKSKTRMRQKRKTPYLRYLTALGLLMAIGLILTGLMVREFSSLVSVGLSMTIFIVGLQFMFPKPTEL